MHRSKCYVGVDMLLLLFIRSIAQSDTGFVDTLVIVICYSKIVASCDINEANFNFRLIRQDLCEWILSLLLAFEELIFQYYRVLRLGVGCLGG